MKSATETEVKIQLTDRAATERRLEAAGFKISVARQFESNDIYDTEDESLRRRGMILRLRQTGQESVVTWKGPGQPGPYKSRLELETSIGSVDTLRRILEHLGYTQAFRYEKYRTEYSEGERRGVVTLDETPIGDYLEIEGPGDWIDSTVLQLGLSPQDYILESYGRLYLEHCRRHGLEPGDMVFPSDSVRSRARGAE